MSSLGPICIAIGILVIVLRAPLIFAPVATIDFYRRLLATDARVRVLGFVVGGLGLGLAFSSDGSPGFRLLGWLLAAVSLFLLVFPATYRSIADNVFEFSEGDTLLPRLVGAIAVLIGLALVYTGAFLL